MSKGPYTFESLEQLSDYLGIPLFECKVCENAGPITETYHDKLHVCSTCAAAIYNVYNEAHGGKRT